MTRRQLLSNAMVPPLFSAARSAPAASLKRRRLEPLLAAAGLCTACTPPARDDASSRIKLPQPRRKSDVSLEWCLDVRRSIRSYRDLPLDLAQAAQLLWSAQGMTAPGGLKTAPSAGALYPLETYLVAGRVDGIPAGVYRYVPESHELAPGAPGDPRGGLARAALDQSPVADAPASIVFSAVYRRTTKKYGQRGVRYVHMEAGHAGENVCLQAAALGLGTVTIGAFHDGEVKRILKLPDEEEPLYILPVGRK